MPETSSAPSVSHESTENLWEDILNSMGSALEDVKRMKNQITSEVDIHFQRIRSAFNCQNVGEETLSAEQIVVEHAVEQVKSGVQQVKAKLNCGAPDASDLLSQEEVIDPSVVDPSYEEEQQSLTVMFKPGKSVGVTFSRETGYVTSLQEGGQAQQMGIKVGMRLKTIDNKPYSGELFDEKESGAWHYKVKFVQDSRILSDGLQEEVSPAGDCVAEPTDLLDLTPAANPATEEVVEAASSSSAPMDLLDLSSDTAVTQSKVEVVAAEMSDLLDLSAPVTMPEVNVQLPAVTATEELTGSSSSQQIGLLGIENPTLQEPTPPQAVHELEDLLDFSDEPAEVASLEQQVPPAIKVCEQQMPAPSELAQSMSTEEQAPPANKVLDQKMPAPFELTQPMRTEEQVPPATGKLEQQMAVQEI